MRGLKVLVASDGEFGKPVASVIVTAERVGAEVPQALEISVLKEMFGALTSKPTKLPASAPISTGDSPERVWLSKSTVTAATFVPAPSIGVASVGLM